jgi:phenylacetate-CoA ligase
MDAAGDQKKAIEESLSLVFKAKIGLTPTVKGVGLGELPRSEKKTKRIFDNRY